MGATIAAGQVLGVAGVYTRTIGRTTVTYAFTHFQVDDFSSNNGLTNQNAVSADKWLDASARQMLDAMWREARYAQELVEPFLDNPRDVTFPLTRVWTLEQGSLATRIDVVAASAYATSYSYLFRDASGGVIETGTIDVEALAKPFSTIDFTPTGFSQPRRGMYNIFEREWQVNYGEPGAPRPANLTGAATYRTR